MLRECRAELGKLVKRSRNKDEARQFLVKLIEKLEPGKALSEVSHDNLQIVNRLFCLLKCPNLQTPDGLEYLRVLALNDFDLDCLP